MLRNKRYLQIRGAIKVTWNKIEYLPVAVSVETQHCTALLWMRESIAYSWRRPSRKNNDKDIVRDRVHTNRIAQDHPQNNNGACPCSRWQFLTLLLLPVCLVLSLSTAWKSIGTYVLNEKRTNRWFLRSINSRHIGLPLCCGLRLTPSGVASTENQPGCYRVTGRALAPFVPSILELLLLQPSSWRPQQQFRSTSRLQIDT